MNDINKYIKQAMGINEQYLCEMAMRRKKAINEIESLIDNILEHITLVYVYKNNDSFNHWVQEISTWLEKFDYITIKPNNKKIDKEYYRDLFFHIDTINDAELVVHSAVAKHMNCLPPDNVNYEGYKSYRNEIYEKLPLLLSDKENHSKEFYQEYINSLVEKYS